MGQTRTLPRSYAVPRAHQRLSSPLDPSPQLASPHGMGGTGPEVGEHRRVVVARPGQDGLHRRQAWRKRTKNQPGTSNSARVAVVGAMPMPAETSHILMCMSFTYWATREFGAGFGAGGKEGVVVTMLHVRLHHDHGFAVEVTPFQLPF